MRQILEVFILVCVVLFLSACGGLKYELISESGQELTHRVTYEKYIFGVRK